MTILPTQLSDIGKYNQEKTRLVDGLSTIIEPLLIVFVGAMIGVVIVVLCFTTFSIGDVIH